MTRLTFVMSSRQVYSNLTLVDDAPPFDVVPKQIFNSDLLNFPTNSNGMLQFPGGCLLDTPVAYNNLTVDACPPNAKFFIECTGALAQSVKAQDRFFAGTVFAEALKAQAQQRAEQATAAERIRAYVPAPVAPVEPPPPPPPRPQWMADADAAAARQVETAATTRAIGTGPTVVGPSLEAIKTELFIAGARQAAEAAAGERANAEMYERVAARKAAQDHATALLKQGHLGG
jgi:hypothetical protein